MRELNEEEDMLQKICGYLHGCGVEDSHTTIRMKALKLADKSRTTYKDALLRMRRRAYQLYKEHQRKDS